LVLLFLFLFPFLFLFVLHLNSPLPHTQVHQLFMDMALMVEQQGELLDNIEEMVSQSAEYTRELKPKPSTLNPKP